jgi:hypothetical protein
MSTRHPLVFALAGEIVRTSRHADQIVHRAIRERCYWLLPQAQSVRRQLQAQEAAKHYPGALPEPK